MAVTLADIAQATNVSVSTASRVWSDPGKVSAATRQKVLKAAHTLGYSPSFHHGAPAPVERKSIGLLVPDVANPFFPPIIKAVQVRARYRGRSVLLADSEEQPGEETRLIRDLRESVDGLVLVSSRMSDAAIRELVGLVPFVLVNRVVEGAPAVVIDDSGAIEQAVEHLAALSHDTICYLNGPKRSWSNVRRRQAVAEACTRRGLEFVEFGPFEPEIQAGVRAADLVMASSLTAIIAYDDMIALGLMARLAERGMVVGQGVSVIGIDDSPMSGMAYPSLTSVHVPGAEAGVAAVDALLDLIESPHSEEYPTRSLEANLILRGSTGLRPAVAPTAK